MKKVRFFLLTKSFGLYINVLSRFSPAKARALSYKLFSNPRYGKLEAGDLPEILKSVEKQDLNQGGNKIQSYVWPGNQETILLVHGWESNASRWELLLPHLSPSGKTIVAIDAPAHGLSQGSFNIPRYADAIHEAVLKFHPKYVIGHSIGGAAIVYYQHVYKNEAIEKVILLGSPSDFDTITDNYIRLLSLNERSKELFESYFTQNFNYHPKDFTAREFGKSMKMKGIIAHDQDDDIVLFPESKKIAGAWKDAIFIETKGLGHSMHDEKLYKEIARFLFEE
ncbi:alpha/beta fold hydrolase [Flavobacterium silvaticum]|uniref:Alpha/beta hydrolase n=1 Tax=Flavobacterium silvaticum TaxID=1852020 RepID=A0A972FPB3_9FLAO|nr:alpha/beta hydrolase [Flavobacterium silvaticum]NMH29373.1 alpha/beta hydrolase [Flavobacterium silvaticum]